MVPRVVAGMLLAHAPAAQVRIVARIHRCFAHHLPAATEISGVEQNLLRARRRGGDAGPDQ